MLLEDGVIVDYSAGDNKSISHSQFVYYI